MTFSFSQTEGLLVSMVRALISQAHPEASFVAPMLADDGGTRALDVSLTETGRWLRLISDRAPTDLVWSAIANGCSAVLTLESDDADFRQGLAALSNGGPAFVAADLLRWMAARAHGFANVPPEHAEPESPVRLTERESEVLQLVAEGFSNADIARALAISPNTVRTHLHALAVKLDGSSRTKILARARALGIPGAGGRPSVLQISESLTA